MSDYTPTTEEVRKAWADWVTSDWLATEQFDRWLAEVRADIWDEGFSAQLWSEQSRNPYRQGEN